jgi:hypothetical protein
VIVVDAGQRSMEGDDGLWLDVFYEADQGPGFGFRPGLLTWAQDDIARIVQGGPVGDGIRSPVRRGKVPIQVHSSGVATSALREPIGIHGQDDGAVGRAFREKPESPGKDDGSFPLLTMNAGMDQEPAGSRGQPNPKRSVERRVPIKVTLELNRAHVLAGPEPHDGGLPMLITNLS